ncbi:single-stranded DNA-binding protein [Komagataeibacter europaeus]|uniref:single-stranded DNA-binding protein n=1 Tax=Komagataeibacter europaeus TaxID=33995 RepID=UPI0002DA6874|nr:single-stranded DNA-binding protein [Komagataeibacter europaeus]GBQ42018.1 single-stranded DNA-binding protein [Komagataeibacter europaeus LMG 18890]
MTSKHILMGHLGSDADIVTLANGKRKARLSVADSEGWRDAEGQWQERTHWHSVVTFQPGLVDYLEKHATKGRLVYVEGAIRSRRYRKDGEETDRTETETIVGPRDTISFPTNDKRQEG